MGLACDGAAEEKGQPGLHRESSWFNQWKWQLLPGLGTTGTRTKKASPLTRRTNEYYSSDTGWVSSE